MVPHSTSGNDVGARISRGPWPNGPGGGGKTTVSLVLARMGAIRVCFDNVFDDAEKFDLFCSALPRETPVFVFTLWTSSGRVIDREANRVGRERMGHAVVRTYEASSETCISSGG